MEDKTKTLVLPIELVYAKQILIFGVVSVLSFCVPFSFGHPQWLVGTLVNTFLFVSAIFLPNKYILPLAVFPSLGLLARGLVFGPLTYFLLYFLPFIWLANLVLIFAFKGLFTKLGYLASLFISALCKFIFLFAIANIYFSFHFVPKIFLQTMGWFQLLTAVGGGLVSWLVYRTYCLYFTENKQM